MKISLITIGRAKPGPEKDLTAHYLARFDAMGGTLGLSKSALLELEEKRPIKGAERQAREANLLLDTIPKGAIVIALDERGKSVTSPDLAKEIARHRDQGTRDLVFLIGGADGFDAKVKSRADKLISFGPATWPHMLVRAMLAEQLYRATTILAGHPYHKD